jgi:hypothetical protein
MAWGYDFISNPSNPASFYELPFSAVTPSWKNMSAREVLTKAAEMLISYFPVSSGGNVGTNGVLITSKYLPEILCKYLPSKWTTLQTYPSGKPTVLKDITANNYFKFKIKKSTSGSINSFRVTATDGYETTVVVTERSEDDGANVYSVSNPIIGGTTMADNVATFLQYTNKQIQQECYFEWQGDPSLELGDEISVTDIAGVYKYSGYLISNQCNFDGGLRTISRMKVIEITAL